MDGVYIRYYIQQQGGRLSVDANEFGDVLKLPKVYQRGRGLGGVFGSFWKYLQPLLMKGANFVKDELIETGSDVLRNLNTQKPMKEILRDRSVQMVDKLRNTAVDKLNSMVGSGGKYKRKRKITSKKSINKKVKRSKSQMKTLAVRVKRYSTAPRKKKIKNKTPKNRILDIFT